LEDILLSQIDPTDHALAAIASIMDPEASREGETAAPADMQDQVSAQVLAEAPAPPPLPAQALKETVLTETVLEETPPEVPPAPVVEETPLAPEAVEANGYFKVGPGPMAAIRFKWTVRRDDNGHFYVDETIGENSAPIVSGPMSADDAIRMVDTRESEARQRFDQLRAEMTGRAATVSLVRNDSGEA
jgi:hypothetical protein